MEHANQNLTITEKKILKDLGQGLLYKEIGVKYSRSINTIKKHCKNIYKKLAVHKRRDALQVFLQSPDIVK